MHQRPSSVNYFRKKQQNRIQFAGRRVWQHAANRVPTVKNHFPYCLRRTSLTGTSPTPKFITAFPCMTRSSHWTLLSPDRVRISTRQSRTSFARKHTPSVIANRFPMPRMLQCQLAQGRRGSQRETRGPLTCARAHREHRERVLVRTVPALRLERLGVRKDAWVVVCIEGHEWTSGWSTNRPQKMELTEADGVHDKARARRDRDALVPVGPDVLEDDVLRRVSDPHVTRR